MDLNETTIRVLRNKLDSALLDQEELEETVGRMRASLDAYVERLLETNLTVAGLTETLVQAGIVPRKRPSKDDV